MHILQYPDPILATKTKAIEKVTPILVDIAKEMYDTMKFHGGIGLAANQVGLDMSLIVIEDNGKMLALFNPVVLKRSTVLEYLAEGCLSFSGMYRLIKRPVEVIVKYRDVNNKMQHQVFKGLQARCVIHEVDHLLGKTFLEYDEKVLDK